MAEVIGAFCRCDCSGDAAECAPERIDGSMGFMPQLGLHFGEDHLDRIEVGAVGRQEQQLSASRFDGAADGGNLMDGKIVHDDDVIHPQRGDEDLLDICDEQLGIDGTVQHVRCDHSVLTYTADEARRLAVTMRHSGDQALADGRPSVRPGHVGLDRSLVEKDQAPWVQAGLAIAPCRPSLSDIRTVLFGGVERLFLCVRPSLRSVPCINALLAVT